MIKITPKDLAKYFRDSISFDLNKNPVESVDDIIKNYDKFYALVEKEAFQALLNDAIGHDKQLVYIFLDLFDLKMGITCFASKQARQSPEIRIANFLKNNPYHKNNIAKVYLAFNTWLAFFGEKTVETQWEVCPFCGSDTKNTPSRGIHCTNKLCQKTAKAFEKAAVELAEILQKEQSGVASYSPDYWDNIKENSEFYTEYKLPITIIREERERAKLEEESKEKTEKIDLAKSEINKIKADLKIESNKQNPDFDSLFDAITSNEIIGEADKYKDSDFTKLVEKLKDDINKAQDDYNKKISQERAEENFKDSVKEILIKIGLLENEFKSSSKGYLELKAIFESTDELYNKIIADVKSGFKIESADTEAELDRYRDELRSEFVEKLENLYRNYIIVTKTELLNTKANLILNCFNGVLPKENKSTEITEKLNTEIETNPEFDEYRIQCKDQYAEILNPVRRELSELIKKENQIKINDFKKRANELLEEISKATPNSCKTNSFKTKLRNLERIKYFASIKSSGEYMMLINRINEEILNLENAENAYLSDINEKKEKKKKRRKIFKIQFIVWTVLIVVTLATLFTCDLAGVMPIPMFLDKNTKGIKGYNSHNQIVITSYDESNKNIVIPDKTRLDWRFSSKEIVEIGQQSFFENKVAETVRLPDTIKQIGAFAFSYCTNLRRIVLDSAIPPSFDDTAFEGSDITFYVPSDSYNTYLEDEQWSNYSYKIFPLSNNAMDEGMIMFDTDGGNDISSINNHKLNTSLDRLPIPHKTGNVFLGWYYDTPSGMEKFEPNDTLLLESVKLFAKWKLGDYKLIFDYNNGEVDIENKVIKYGDYFGVLPTPKRTGYTFDGWYMDGNKVTENTRVEISQNKTLVAKWIQNSYNITFDYQGGLEYTDSKNVIYDEKFGVLPDTEKIGYNFIGWYNGDTKITEDTDVKILEDTTLKAVFVPITYKIKYILNGGSMDIGETTYKYDEKIILGTPNRAGYTFVNWTCNGHGYNAASTVDKLTSKDGDVLQFYANWIAVKNKIQFNANGGHGTMSDLEIATDGHETLTKNAFIREGYKFEGWSSIPFGPVEYADGALFEMSVKPITILYAVWSADSQRISLNNYIGTEITDKKDLYAQTDHRIKLDNYFKRAGYTMIGWSLTKGGELKYPVGCEYIVTANDIELYTVWKANTNTIEFNSFMGEGEMSSITASTDSTLVLPKSAFTKRGYTFAGWSEYAGGEVKYKDGAEIKVGTLKSTVLYAVWIKDIYTIKYELNGGANSKLNPTSYSVDSENIVLENPTRSGYTFEGWFSDSGMTVVLTEIRTGSTGNLNLFAKWKANKNTLHFNANGGSGTMEDIYIDTDAVQLLPDIKFTKPGFVFAGWKRSNDPSESVSIPNQGKYLMGTESEYTLYAVWKLRVYNIEYYLDGGTNATGNPNNYTIESNSITLKPATKLGYTFGGWFTDISLTKECKDIASGTHEDIKLYAKWIPNQNKIIFNGNGGVGEMGVITVPTDGEINLPENVFFRKGYTFLGWKLTDNPEEGATYSNGDLFKMGTNKEYVLYAVWLKNNYTISYETNGGTNNSANPLSYNIESGKITILPATKEGYTFISWYSDSSMTVECNEIPTGSTENLTLYAKFVANKNTIHFDANGGEGTMADQQVSTGNIVVLNQNKFYRKGYKFAGWSLIKGSTSVYGDKSGYTVGAEPYVTLYAVWTQTQFTIQYDLDGGTNSTANPMGYNSEAATIILAAPTKTGFTFRGWFTDSGYQNKIENIPTGSKGDLHIYAKWEKNQYTVSFDYNGSPTMAPSKNVLYSDNYGTLPAPTWKGHTFVGWYLGSTLIKEDTKVILTNNHTLVAKWTTNSYNISFNLAGGSGNSSQKTILFGTKYGTLPTVSRVGYTFNGWFYNNKLVTADTVMDVADNHILVAKWTANVYTLTFNYNGGSGSVQTMQVTYGTKFGTLPTATKTGHSYKWYIDGAVVNADDIVKITSNKTVVAKWTVNSYTLYINESNVNITVKRKDNGAEVFTNASVPYGTRLVISFTTNEGYKDGWCKPTGEITMPANNYTIEGGATKDSCLAKGTPIMLPNGTFVPIETLKVGDEILTYDHATGQFVKSVIGFTYYDYEEVFVINLMFENGKILRFVNNGHGLYDLTLDKYVLITPENAQDYIGHSFVFVDRNFQVEGVKLTDCTVTTELIERYDIVSVNNLNHIANGALACSDTLVGVSNTFEFNSTVYDMEQLQKDIETYGLYTYEEWSDYITEEEFIAFNGKYFKIAIGKGLITEEEIFSLIDDIRSLWQ